MKRAPKVLLVKLKTTIVVSQHLPYCGTDLENLIIFHFFWTHLPEGRDLRRLQSWKIFGGSKFSSRKM